VILPVVRPPAMIDYAIRSVLAQDEQDFELCVCCDGAPPETAARAREFGATDPRIFVFDFPKGQRNGELHRAAILHGAQTQFVAHIGDDDIWFPEHLTQLGRLLERHDFVSFCQFNERPNGSYYVQQFGDLRLHETQTKMLETYWNFFGPSEAGYRLDAYFALPDGWTPAGPEIASDLYMWRKFIIHPRMRLCSSPRVTGLKFATADWKPVPLEQRAVANGRKYEALKDATVRKTLARKGTRMFLRGCVDQPLLTVLRLDPIVYLPLIRARIKKIRRKLRI